MSEFCPYATYSQTPPTETKQDRFGEPMVRTGFVVTCTRTDRRCDLKNSSFGSEAFTEGGALAEARVRLENAHMQNKCIPPNVPAPTAPKRSK